MTTLHMMIFTMLVASLSVQHIEAVTTPYGVRVNRDSHVTMRNRRQSHPAATIARFPEQTTAEPEATVFLPEPIDHLTPPRPPDSSQTEPVLVKNPSVLIPTQVAPDSQLANKWQLNYDASEILNPPSDPLYLVNDNEYKTITHVVLKEDTTGNNNQSPIITSNENTGFTKINEAGRDDFDPVAAFSGELDPGHRFVEPLFEQHFFNKRQTKRPKRMTIYYDKKKNNNNPDENDTFKYNKKDEYEEDDENEYNDEYHSAKKKPFHVYTFVKTDKHGHFKWGVRQHGGIF